MGYCYTQLTAGTGDCYTQLIAGIGNCYKQLTAGIEDLQWLTADTGDYYSS